MVKQHINDDTCTYRVFEVGQASKTKNVQQADMVAVVPPRRASRFPRRDRCAVVVRLRQLSTQTGSAISSSAREVQGGRRGQRAAEEDSGCRKNTGERRESHLGLSLLFLWVGRTTVERGTSDCWIISPKEVGLYTVLPGAVNVKCQQ